MKLLIYSHFFAPSVGGVETIVDSLARGLAGLGDPQGLPQFEITLATETPAGGLSGPELPFRVVRKPGWAELAKLVRSADLVHLAGPALGPLLLGYLFRKRVVVEHHGFQAVCPNGQLLVEPGGVPCPGQFMAGRHHLCLRCNAASGWLGSVKLWFATFLRRFFCARVAFNLTPTEWLGSLLELPQTVPLPHGLGSAGESAAPARRSEPPVLIFLGRLVSTKGLRVLLGAAKILSERHCPFQLRIIGEGPERAWVEQFVSDFRLGASVRCLGPLGAVELEQALSGATALVVPSLGGEVFGLAAAEGMARGLPVIASDLGAFSEVIGDTGLLFETGNAEALAGKIRELLGSSALVSALSQAARERILSFYSRGRMIEAHAGIFARARFGAPGGDRGGGPG